MIAHIYRPLCVCARKRIMSSWWGRRWKVNKGLVRLYVGCCENVLYGVVIGRGEVSWRIDVRGGINGSRVKGLSCKANWKSFHWVACPGWECQLVSCQRVEERTVVRWHATKLSLATVTVEEAFRSALVALDTLTSRSPQERTATFPADWSRDRDRSVH